MTERYDPDMAPLFRRPDVIGGYEVFIESLTALPLRKLLGDARVAKWLAEQLDEQTLVGLTMRITDVSDYLNLNPETIRRAACSDMVPFDHALPAGGQLFWKIDVERYRVMREIHPPTHSGGRHWHPPKDDKTDAELEKQLVAGAGTRAQQIENTVRRIREDSGGTDPLSDGITGGKRDRDGFAP